MTLDKTLPKVTLHVTIKKCALAAGMLGLAPKEAIGRKNEENLPFPLRFSF